MKQKAYTLGEEIFSSVTHGVGTLLSVGGTVVLIVAAAMFGDALTVVSVTVFGASMFILYTISGVYHARNVPIRHLAISAIFYGLEHIVHAILAKARQFGKLVLVVSQII